MCREDPGGAAAVELSSFTSQLNGSHIDFSTGVGELYTLNSGQLGECGG